jgi:hypothetical protein
MIPDGVTKAFQLAGAVLAIPAAAAGTYTAYKTYFTADGACQAMRSAIVATLDKQMPAETKRALLRKDVAAFEEKCAAHDPDGAAAFRAALTAPIAASAAAGPATGVASAADLSALLPGDYVRNPVQNDWHIGSIVRDGDGLRWTNKAGRSWKLTYDAAQQTLHTGADNPYHARGWRDVGLILSEGKIVGLRINGEAYAKSR